MVCNRKFFLFLPSKDEVQIGGKEEKSGENNSWTRKEFDCRSQLISSPFPLLDP